MRLSTDDDISINKISRYIRIYWVKSDTFCRNISQKQGGKKKEKKRKEKERYMQYNIMCRETHIAQNINILLIIRKLTQIILNTVCRLS